MTRAIAALMLFVLGCIAGLPGEATAQDPLRKYNKNPVMISAQIRLAMEFEARAFELLPTATRSNEDLQITKDTVYEAYKMIRFAIGGVRYAQNHSKFPDPTLEMQDQLMEKARTNLRACLAELNRVGTGRVERLHDAHTVLTESYRTLQDLQVLLP
jgi:hypothetical protein